MRKILSLAAAGLLFAGSALAGTDITGAGATFPAPLYAKWAEAAKKDTGISLNYQAIGSGGGQTQITNRTVDFGASDAAMDAKKLKDAKLVQVPAVIGAVVVIVNIPGVETNKLKLRQAVLADIYLGKIKSWDDKRIVADNPDLKLPKLAIAPVYRADGSGTTAVFTGYLRTISYEWLKAVGEGTSVKWKAGTGAKGNDGVAAAVKQVKGAIGYVEHTYAAQGNLITAQLMNRAKKWVSPTPAAFKSAADTAEWAKAKDYDVDILDQPGDGSWPIVSATFLLIPTDAKDPSKTKAVRTWLEWGYTKGGTIAEQLGYVVLPAAVQKQVLEGLNKTIK